MKALIIGASGATGRALLSQLLQDAATREVAVFVRKPLGITHAKLVEHLIDFEDENSWAEKVRGDVLFSCLGTTIKQAGSQAKQWSIDHDYQLAFARAAARNGVAVYALVSADGAHPDARVFYPRMKGALDEAVRQLGFRQCLIFRPSLLKRPGSDRCGEKAAEFILSVLNRLGLFRAHAPLPVAHLAKAMIAAVKAGRSGIVDKTAIRALVAE